MSYDFELYTTRRHALATPRTSTSLNLRVDGPDHVEDEDLPDTYLPVLGRKRILFKIHLEGEPTPSDEVTLNAWLGAIVMETKGVLIDLQTARYETPTAQGILDSQVPRSGQSGWMSFYFEDGETFYESGFRDMLGQIAQIMPEAAPARFGDYEPLQSRVEDLDFSELVASYKTKTDLIIQCKAPFGHLTHWVPCKKTGERYHPEHFMRRHFALGYLSFEVRPNLFAHPAILSRLTALFETLCVTLDVVYAEIVETNARRHFLWRGLPDNVPLAVCLGPTYQNVWPAFRETGYKIGDHHHIVTNDRLGNKPPQPPSNLVAPYQSNGASRGKPRLASVFPFDYDYSPDKYVW